MLVLERLRLRVYLTLAVSVENCVGDVLKKVRRLLLHKITLRLTITRCGNDSRNVLNVSFPAGYSG